MGERAETVTETAPAKLNPYLRVLRRRDDGYHDIETIVLPLDLADTVTVRLRDEPGFELRVTGPRSEEVPSGDENLVLGAAHALGGRVAQERGAVIELDKRVPVAAGLGGGSSDAAATLRALNRAWGLGLDAAELAAVGASVGSDVPALIRAGPVLARGRGEIVVQIDAPATSWVLVTFDVGISAADAYGWWDESLRRRIQRPQPVDAALRMVASGDPEAIAGTLHNSLEWGIFRRHPSVEAARQALGFGGHPDGEVRSDGAVGVIVCGSGPTVAGLCRDREHAEQLAAAVNGIAASTLAD